MLFPLIRHASRATFPRQGGRLIGATIETTVQWGKCQCWSLPPHGGRWHGEAVTDEGENARRSLQIQVLWELAWFLGEASQIIHGYIVEFCKID